MYKVLDIAFNHEYGIYSDRKEELKARRVIIKNRLARAGVRPYFESIKDNYKKHLRKDIKIQEI